MSDDSKPVSLLGTIQIPIKVQGKETEFHCQISPPGPMTKVEELEEALKSNRDLLGECQEEMFVNLKKDYFDRVPPWKLDYDSPVQNALVARFNINVLIPLINMKGGRAKFTKLESWPVKKHIEKMMGGADKKALGYQDMRMTPLIYAKRVTGLSLLVLAFVFIYIAVT